MAESSFRVAWTETAVRDLEELVAYIASHSDTKASRVLARLESRANTLTSTPARGRVVPELAHFGIRSWRELIVRPHRIIYRVDGHTVYVLAVVDGRRELHDLLLERLIRD